MEILALFGPTGVGKTAVAIALAELLRARGEDPVAVSADALQVYAGLEILTGVAAPGERAVLEHRLVSFLPLDAGLLASSYSTRLQRKQEEEHSARLALLDELEASKESLEEANRIFAEFVSGGAGAGE